MSFAKLALVAAIGWGGMHLWNAHARAVLDRELSAAADSYGFVPVAPPDGVPSDSVLILAALNCPSEQAQRADAMAKRLGEMGIPAQRANNYSITHVTRDQIPLINRTSAVLEGTIPIVFVNGMAKANPTVEEVALELHKGR
jgi:hypothetical protein